MRQRQNNFERLTGGIRRGIKTGAQERKATDCVDTYISIDYENIEMLRYRTRYRMIKIPYVREHPSRNALTYQRDYPKSLQAIIDKKTFTYPVGEKGDDQTLILQRVSEAEQAYLRKVRMAETIDPSALELDDLQQAALDLLKQRKAQGGQLAYQDNQADEYGLDRWDYADHYLPEMDIVRQKEQQQQLLTANEMVVKHAYAALVDAAAYTPKTLSRIWEAYSAFKGLDDKHICARRYQRFLAYLGKNQVISAQTNDVLNKALRGYVENRQGEGVKNTTIARELNDILAVLRYAADEYGIAWSLKKPRLKNDADKRRPLNREEQRQVLQFIQTKDVHKGAAVCVLLYLQGGVSPKELQTFVIDETRDNLNQNNPFVLIRAGKTTKRKRVIPIVLMLDYVKQHIEETINWVNSVTSETVTKQIRKILREATGDVSLTGYFLRHTFKANAFAAGVADSHIAAIGGWSGKEFGLSDHMLEYGSEGLSDSETVRSLTQTSQKIHQHLL